MTISLSSLQAKRSNPVIVWIIAASLAIIAMTFVPVAKAQETPAPTLEKAGPPNPYRYAPDFCDFEITFPERPQVAEKCITGSGCYEVNSYTMVYDLQTTVDVTVTCNPSTKAAYDKYTKGVIKAALAGMVEQRNLTNYDIGFKDYPEENVKTGSLTGTGMTGASGKIYTGQLWIGQNSVFTVQAELIGMANDKADGAFRDILASIKTKKGKQIEKAPEPPRYKQKNNQ